MIDKRYYWGDLRLWKTGRKHKRPNSRGQMLEYQGDDQQHTLLIPASPNFSGEMAVVTAFDPPDTSQPTSERFHLAIDQYQEAMEARANGYLHPLVLVHDATDLTAVIDSLAAPEITCPVAHPFLVGDRVLCRRNGLNLYSILVVATVPSSTKFTYTGASHTILAGDTLVRVSAYWDDVAYLNGPECSEAERGQFYSPEALWRFKAPATATYRRVALTLPS